MNWDAISAIGEVIGATAVVVTLGYLAIQLRQARSEYTRNNARDLVVRNNAVLGKLADDKELRERHIRGMQDFGALAGDEKLAFGIWIFTWISNWEQAYVDQKSGSFEGLPLETYSMGIAEVLRTPGGTEYWLRNKDYFSTDTASEIDRVIGLSEQTWLERFHDPKELE
jgi:hypothetical protein